MVLGGPRGGRGVSMEHGNFRAVNILCMKQEIPVRVPLPKATGHTTQIISPNVRHRHRSIGDQKHTNAGCYLQGSGVGRAEELCGTPGLYGTFFYKPRAAVTQHSVLTT